MKHDERILSAMNTLYVLFLLLIKGMGDKTTITIDPEEPAIILEGWLYISPALEKRKIGLSQSLSEVVVYYLSREECDCGSRWEPPHSDIVEISNTDNLTTACINAMVEIHKWNIDQILQADYEQKIFEDYQDELLV